MSIYKKVETNSVFVRLLLMRAYAAG